MRTLVIGMLTLCAVATGQDPVFRPELNIDQDLLLKGQIPLKKVLESGGDFWTTPFQPYSPSTKKGDGYGEGNAGTPGQADGPRAAQRHAFNPLNPKYPLLRLNGLDSQSCYECHNSVASSTSYVGMPNAAQALS